MKSLFFVLFMLLLSACEKSTIISENISDYEALRRNFAKIADFGDEVDAYCKADTTTGGVTFTGSSTITNWVNLKEDFPDAKVRNRGIGGSTIIDIIGQSEKLIFQTNPQLLVLYIGDNDGSFGFIEIEQYQYYLTLFANNFLHRLQDSNIVLLSLKPSPIRRPFFAFYEAVNQSMKNLATNNSRIEYVDIWTPIYSNPSAYFLSDNLHLNQTGYDLIIEKLTPIIKGCEAD